ncbi:MAG: alpha/beta fold hydrolase [bacterium]|nr:alpha/beta fold hydrolase [bacterium]
MKQMFFEKINGKKIFAILTEPENPQKKIVIMCHGFRGSSLGPSRIFVDFERLLLKNGFSVLRFDQPNSGNSEGDFLNTSFDEWTKTTVYFAKKFLDNNYKVTLLGQSMGGACVVIASASEELKDKIQCLLLWVPDPKSTFNNVVDAVYEENGQKYKGTFWQEVKEADFFGCLEKYKGAIHLVYGEEDKFITKDLREQVMAKVGEKGQPFIILPGQDHSPWAFDSCQKVYREELDFLRRCFG